MRFLLLALLLAPSAAAADGILTIPIPDAERGRDLFVSKGCVVCHSVNGVGGAVAPALDATEPAGVFDPVDFAARMWRGAQAMTALQETELGYQIELSGQETADFAAFSEHHALQAGFTEEMIPEIIRGWTLNYYDDAEEEME